MKNYLISLFILFIPSIAIGEESSFKVKTAKKVTVQAGSTLQQLPKTKSEENSDTDANAQEQQVLDLSLPPNIQETTISDDVRHFKKRDYLPNLFVKKKKKNSKKLQADGKIIKKEEQETGKDRVADGVGINIKLIH